MRRSVRLAAPLVLLSSLAACSKPPPPPAPEPSRSALPMVADAPKPRAPAADPLSWANQTGLPEWASKFRKAASAIGKPKDALVAAAGTPDSAGPKQYVWYVSDQGGTIKSSVFADFDGDTVRTVYCQITGMGAKYARELWPLIGAGGPTAAWYNAKGTLEFLKGGDASTPGGRGFLVELEGDLPGGAKLRTDLLEYRVPAARADRKLNTKTDSFELGPLERNPAFDWGLGEPNYLQATFYARKDISAGDYPYDRDLARLPLD